MEGLDGEDCFIFNRPLPLIGSKEGCRDVMLNLLTPLLMPATGVWEVLNGSRALDESETTLCREGTVLTRSLVCSTSSMSRDSPSSSPWATFCSQGERQARDAKMKDPIDQELSTTSEKGESCLAYLDCQGTSSTAFEWWISRGVGRRERCGAVMR